MRIAITGIAGVIVLLSIAVPVPTPASAQIEIVLPYSQWRAPGPHPHRKIRRRPAAGGESYRSGPVQCAAASHLCGWRRIPRPPIEGHRAPRQQK